MYRHKNTVASDSPSSPRLATSTGGVNNTTAANIGTFEEDMSLEKISRIIRDSSSVQLKEPNSKDLQTLLLRCVDIVRVSKEIQKRVNECDTHVKKSTKSIKILNDLESQKGLNE